MLPQRDKAFRLKQGKVYVLIPRPRMIPWETGMINGRNSNVIDKTKTKLLHFNKVWEVVLIKFYSDFTGFRR